MTTTTTPTDLDLMAFPPLTVHLDVETHRFALDSQYAHKDFIELVPGSAYRGRGKDYWRVPRTYSSLILLRNMFGDSLVLDDEVQAWAESEWKGRIGPAYDLRNGKYDPELIEQIRQMTPGKLVPKDHQVAGALYLATARNAFLFDEMGNGKTLTVGMTLRLYPQTLPALIICPKSLLYTWEAGLEDLGIKSVVISGDMGKAKRDQLLEEFDPEETPVMIISYKLVQAYSRVSGYGNITLSANDKKTGPLNEIPWHTIVADECQKIKDPSATQTRAVWAVSEKAQYRFGLTGTPIESSVLDFYYLLRWIAPDEFPSRVKAQDRYIETETDWFGAVTVLGLKKHTADEFRFITEWHWRRELKNLDVGKEYEFRYCVLAPRERKAYDQMAKQNMAELEDESILLADGPMVAFSRARQMANSALITDEDGTIRPTEPSAKLDLLAETISDLDGAPAIIWFASRKLLELQLARLEKAAKPPYTYGVITGSVKAKDRTQIVSDFQAGLIDYVYIVEQAGAEGLTLTRAGVAIYVNEDPSLILKKQSEDRNHRIGTTHESIRYIYLLTRDTVEEKIVTRFAEKDGKSQEILRDNETS